MFGGITAANWCADWTLPTRPFPAAKTAEAPPLLMLQSRYDGLNLEFPMTAELKQIIAKPVSDPVE